MKRTLSRAIPFMLCFVLTMGFMMIIGQHTASASYRRYVTVDFLNVRTRPSASSKIVDKVYWKDEVTCLGTNGDWTKILGEDEEELGYVKTEYLSRTLPTITYKSAYKRYVKTSTSIYKTPSTGSQTVGSYDRGDRITCYGVNNTGNWTVVKKNGKEYFVLTKKLTSSYVKSGPDGKDVVNYAKKFVGNPYVYGGNSLTNGTDCSGFTKLVYKHFGYTLPRTSGEQRSTGKRVSWSEKKPGDLICYYGHVAIYAGNNTVVHASSRKTGIKTTSPANYRAVASVRRIINN